LIGRVGVEFSRVFEMDGGRGVDVDVGASAVVL
jgi:hypothetical protein